MTQRALVERLHRLEEASEDILATAPTCLKAACAAAEVGDLKTCCSIIDRTIPVFKDADGQLEIIAAELIGLFNELTYHPTAA